MILIKAILYLLVHGLKEWFFHTASGTFDTDDLAESFTKATCDNKAIHLNRQWRQECCNTNNMIQTLHGEMEKET